MPKRKTVAAKRRRVSFGALAFAGIFVVAYAAIWFPANAAETLLLTAVLGMAVAIFNIRRAEERDFLIAISALLISILTLSLMLGPISMLSMFLTYLAVGFGVAGIITAFYLIIRLGFRE